MFLSKQQEKNKYLRYWLFQAVFYSFVICLSSSDSLETLFSTTNIEHIIYLQLVKTLLWIILIEGKFKERML